MFIPKLAVATLVGAALIVPGVALADAPAPSRPCVFREHRVTAVTPYQEEVRTGRAVSKRLRGAEIRIQAEPGLTAEWLRLKVGRHLAAMRGMSMPDCSLDMDAVKVAVVSSGDGFAVRVIANDSEQAKEVLRRASLLVQ